MRARANASYDNTYHHKYRGRVWRALKDTEYEKLHDQPVPLGLCFSNPYPGEDVDDPWGVIEEGETRHLIISAVEEELLAHVAQDLLENRELNIGEMPFYVEDVQPVDSDVGEPGTSGVITTHTGVCVRFSPGECEEYGIDTRFDDTDTYWQPEHTMRPFIDAITSNLQYKHERFGPDYVPGPLETDHDLFQGYERIKNFAIPVTVTTGVTTEMVLSKWNFTYTVQSDTHRKHLNLLMDTGVGERNGFGLGFCNIIRGGPRDLGQAQAAGDTTTNATARGD